MYYRYHAILSIFFISLSLSNSIVIDLDPIESNQYLINEFNANILEKFDYESIIFNQSHHIPYGSFLFSAIDELSTIDTLGMKSQFVLRKGDFSFRDLIISTYRINNQNIHFRYIGLVRSYDPTAISNLTAQNFLQNHMISIIKSTESTHLSSQILQFSEDPNVPISYYWDLNDLSKSYYHTRKSSSTIWGITIKHQINDHINFSYKNSNQYSTLLQYINDSDNSNSSSQNKYIDDIYYSGSQNMYIDYTTKKVIFFSSLSLDNHDSHMSSYSNNNIEIVNANIGIKADLGNSHFHLSLVSNRIDINTKQYFSNTPFLLYSYRINKESKISYSVGFYDGIYDERKYESSSNNYEYLRGILRFANQELSYNLDLNNQSIKIGAGKIDSISTYNINSNDNYSDSYTYFTIGYKYVRHFFEINMDSKKYLKFNDKFSSYSMWLDSYLNYSFKLSHPIKNKPYTIYFEGRGKLLSIKKGGLFVNEFPLICNNSFERCYMEQDELFYRHFIDLVFGIEFENFTLSYHTITNNGDDFSWGNSYSDIGDNFGLPRYSFGDSEYSLFHYIKISWIFLD